MVAGVLLARYAAASAHFAFSFVGLAQVVLGGVMLVWSGRHYDDLHGPLRAGDSPVHPTAARIIGVGTIGFSGIALVFAIVISLDV